MKRRALLLALLSTTCMSPSEARADPVTGFIAGVASFVQTGATVGAGIGGAFAAGSATAAFFAGPVGSILLSLGLSAIAASLQPRPEAPKPSERMVNFAQPISYQERVYGRARKGGPIGFTGFKAANRIYAVILAAHPINAVIAHWLDERLVQVANGVVTSDPPGDYVGVSPQLGTAGQVAHPTLLNNFPEWTSSHNMKGLSYAVLSAGRPDPEKFSKIYPRGREPAYLPVIEGHNQIYDPRTGARGYTQNLALCLAHEITEYQGRLVDWDEVAEEADACEAGIVDADGNLRNKWTVGAVISDDAEWEDIRSQFMAAGDVYFYERTDGKVGFRVGRWIDPTVTLTERDFLAFEISEGRDMDSKNEFVVRYVEPQNAWRETPSGVWRHNPGERRNREEISTFYVNNHNQAARIAKRMARTRRARYTISGTLSLSGYELLSDDRGGVHRFATLDHSELGINVPIEIGRLVWNADRITFGLEATSTDPADFAFASVFEEPPRPSYGDVQSSETVPLVTGLSAVASSSTGGTAAITWTWPAQDAAYRQQLRYKRTAESEWTYIAVPGEQFQHTATGLLDGGVYEAQVRNKTGSGTPSDWRPEVPLQTVAIANQTPPGALSNFIATGDVGQATVSFDAPNDAQYFATRIYRSTTSDFNDATLVRTEYGIPSNADSWIDTDVSAQTYYYWGEPINSSGVGGTVAGPDSAIVT